MPSTIFLRSFFPVAAWFVLLTGFGVSFVKAEEFKPFLKLQIPSPAALFDIVEKVSAVVDTEDASGLKANLASFKDLPGLEPTGTINLALQANENSALFGLDFLILLPINDLAQLDITGLPDEFMLALTFLQMAEPTDGKYVLPTPFGVITAYQKSGYFLIATEGAAASAESADRQKLFAEVDQFTFGVHFDWENVSAESIGTALGIFTALPLMLGMDIGGDSTGGTFDIEALLQSITDLRDEYSVFTAGVALEPETLDLTGTIQIAPKQGSVWAEKILRLKNTETKLGAFVPETPQTVLAYHCLDYYTDKEIDELGTTLEIIGESFVEGLYDVLEEEESGVQLAQAAELFLEYAGEVLGLLAENRLVDYTVWLDSEGTFLFAIGTDKTAAITKLGEEYFGSLLEIFGGESGRTVIEAKTKKDYETIAGYSLSSVPNLFADLPESVELPDAVKNIPLSLFCAVKEGEAVVYAAGLDFAKTEAALKDALAKAATSEPPKQTLVFAFQPFGELLQKQVLPLFEQAGLEYEYGKPAAAKFADADAGAKVVMTTEFSGDACHYNFHVSGKVWLTALEVLAGGFTMESNAE